MGKKGYQNIAVFDCYDDVIAKRYTSRFEERCAELFRELPDACRIETVGNSKIENEARWDRYRAKAAYRSRNGGRNPRRDRSDW